MNADFLKDWGLGGMKLDPKPGSSRLTSSTLFFCSRKWKVSVGLKLQAVIYEKVVLERAQNAYVSTYFRSAPTALQHFGPPNVFLLPTPMFGDFLIWGYITKI